MLSKGLDAVEDLKTGKGMGWTITKGKVPRLASMEQLENRLKYMAIN